MTVSSVGALDSVRVALLTLRERMLELERRDAAEVAALPSAEQASARNLLHSLALRQVDVPSLQSTLDALGLASLDRSQTHLLAGLETVLDAARRLAELPAELPSTEPPSIEPPLDATSGRSLPEERAERLLGPSQAGRRTRIVVTLPSEAATDTTLVQALVDAGMDLARIDCAHDSADRWSAMAENVQAAAQQCGREVRIVADLGGPRIRTGEIESGPRVVRWGPERDVRGMPVASARIWITFAGSREVPPEGLPLLPLERRAIEETRVGDELRVRDLRGRRRTVRIIDRQGEALIGECERGVWIEEGNRVDLRRHGEPVSRTRVVGLPPTEEPIRLRPGDRLILTGDGELGRAARRDDSGKITEPARIACTLPSALDAVRLGQRVMFDDGKISAQVVEAGGRELQLVIDRGGTLRTDLGINFPDTPLELRGLTDKDRGDLEVVTRFADVIGMPFVQSVDDVLDLQSALARCGVEGVGVLLGIETRLAVETLPRVLLAALRSPAAGVMVRRGDLAAEVGYERLAEVEEEISALCTAAHLPVVWTTPVLATLARKGQPARAEVTDAAMSGRAEAVVLDKGPFVARAVELLGDVLVRLQSRAKKNGRRGLAVSDLDFG